MKVFLDANILVSVLNKEYPVFTYSSRVLSLADHSKYKFYTSPLCLAIAYYFAEKMNSNFYGFTMVAGIFLITLILFIIIYKNYFSGKVMNMVTGIFFENDTTNFDEDEE